MTTSGSPWNVTWTGQSIPGVKPSVLVQLHEAHNMVSVPLTPAEAESMANELLKYAQHARRARPLEDAVL